MPPGGIAKLLGCGRGAVGLPHYNPLLAPIFADALARGGYPRLAQARSFSPSTPRPPL